MTNVLTGRLGYNGFAIGDNQDLVNSLGRFYVDPTTIDMTLPNADALYNSLRTVATKLDMDLSNN
jgi:hypothetical protein